MQLIFLLDSIIFISSWTLEIEIKFSKHCVSICDETELEWAWWLGLILRREVRGKVLNIFKEKSSLFWLEYVRGCRGGSSIRVGSRIKVIIQEQAPTYKVDARNILYLYITDMVMFPFTWHYKPDTQQLFPSILTQRLWHTFSVS